MNLEHTSQLRRTLHRNPTYEEYGMAQQMHTDPESSSTPETGAGFTGGIRQGYRTVSAAGIKQENGAIAPAVSGSSTISGPGKKADKKEVAELVAAIIAFCGGKGNIRKIRRDRKNICLRLAGETEKSKMTYFSHPGVLLIEDISTPDMRQGDSKDKAEIRISFKNGEAAFLAEEELCRRCRKLTPVQKTWSFILPVAVMFLMLFILMGPPSFIIMAILYVPLALGFRGLLVLVQRISYAGLIAMFVCLLLVVGPEIFSPMGLLIIGLIAGISIAVEAIAVAGARSLAREE